MLSEEAEAHAESNPRPSEEVVSFYLVLRPLDQPCAVLATIVDVVTAATDTPVCRHHECSVRNRPGGPEMCYTEKATEA